MLRRPLPERQIPVCAVSALEGTGVSEVWEDVQHFRAALERTGAWSQRRAEQARAAVEAEVMAGTHTPAAAARVLLAAFLGKG
jgi:putative protein kinase ArgK-like GTPase of G3E family